MHQQKRVNESVHWHMGELKARVVAQSGRAKDRFHLGKLILQGLKDAPDFTLQIDGATGNTQNYGSVLERSVKCANALRTLGLQCGDVIVLMAPNHLDLIIPYYAGFYLGVIVANIDQHLQIKELQDIFSKDEPKVIFCQSDRVENIKSALEKCNLQSIIVPFDDNTSNEVNCIIGFKELLNKYGEGSKVDDFKAADFDPEETIALLISTSGTTGLPKQAATTHKNFCITNHCQWLRDFEFPTPTRLAMILSPLQWLSSLIFFITAPIVRITLLQSALPMVQDHVYHLINTYKPTYTVISPTMLTTLINPKDRAKCDFTCFETIHIGGSAVSKDLVTKMKNLSPKTEAFNVHGMSEICSMSFLPDSTESGSCGKPATYLRYRLINVETQEDILGPHERGELWMNGPSVFKGYYKNDDATKRTFSKDGWLKTGDIFYRDEQWNFFFVERMKLLLKYKTHQISPVEVENVIRQHPGVLDVGVCGIPDPECGDLAVACIVRHSGHNVTAQEIKDLVKETLTDSKQLRGGVVFLDTIPVTATTKVDYRHLQEIVLQMKREQLF